MASINLKDAYLLVPVDKSYKKFICFKYLDSLCEFNALPFWALNMCLQN